MQVFAASSSATIHFVGLMTPLTAGGTRTPSTRTAGPAYGGAVSLSSPRWGTMRREFVPRLACVGRGAFFACGLHVDNSRACTANAIGKRAPVVHPIDDGFADSTRTMD